MAKLYPPNIEGTIPAFYQDVDSGTTPLVVPFSMNRAVGKSEISGFALKVKYVDGTVIDTFLTTTTDLTALSYYDLENNMVAVFNVTSIADTILKIGQYYKIQIAYIGLDGVVGYYSTVGVVKYTERPKVYIEKLDENEINSHQYSYTGVYDQQNKDVTEKLYQYRFIVKDMDGNIIEDTEWKLHNTSEDDLPYESRETFLLSQDLKTDQTYYITFRVQTINGVDISSHAYRLIQTKSIGTEIDLGLKASLDYENGLIKLNLICDEPIVSGTFLISKASSKDNYKWTEFRRFDMQSMVPSSWSVVDCTIEQGVTYKYSLQQYNEYDIYSERVQSEEVFADFEHAFLYDGTQQLKIKFDPKITNFKNNIPENKVETIGAKYPFIVRNGNVYYKSFDIQGLISFQTDESGLFLDQNTLIKDNFLCDLTSNNIASERIFKRSVQDWLNNGKPKIFKSPTEGNFIVRILNVSLTPNDKVGRMLHSFKGTAYEIAEFTTQNLEKYKLIDPSENLSLLTRWKTVNILEIAEENNYENKWVPINDGRIIYSVDIQDCVPGTIIMIQEGLDVNYIEIGVTGAYYAESQNGFSAIAIRPSDYDVNFVSTSPSITYSFNTKAVSVFGTITKVQAKDIPLRQFVGEVRDINGERKELIKYLNDTRCSVTHFGVIRFKKRDLQDIFINCNDPYEFNPNVALQQYNFYLDKEKTQQVSLNKLMPLGLYEIRCTEVFHSLEENYGKPTNNYYDAVGKIHSYRGYYQDIENEKFEPYTGYILDGYNHKIYALSPDLFSFKINGEEILDLEQTEEYDVQDVKLVTSIEPNMGVITEVSYSEQISTYIFDNQPAVKKAYQNYQNTITGTNPTGWNTLFNRYVQSNGHIVMNSAQQLQYTLDLINQKKKIDKAYDNYIKALDAAILKYKKENGLEI